MKKAFTLAEALITIGIIGIIAALTFPTISHIRPNQNKVLYLKTFDALQQSVLAFASNTKEYPVCGRIGIGMETYNLFYGRVGANTINAPLLNVFSSYADNDNNLPNRSMSAISNWRGNTKLCNLLAWGMNGIGVNGGAINCSDRWNVQPSSADINIPVSFVIPNGVQFFIGTRNRNIPNGAGQGTYSVNAAIDVNGAGQPNCSYNNPNCLNPDRFWFMITADGTVTPADPIGRAYVQTRNSNSVKNMTKYINDNGLDNYIQWGNNANNISESVNLGACNQ